MSDTERREKTSFIARRHIRMCRGIQLGKYCWFHFRYFRRLINIWFHYHGILQSSGQYDDELMIQVNYSRANIKYKFIYIISTCFTLSTLSDSGRKYIKIFFLNISHLKNIYAILQCASMNRQNSGRERVFVSVKKLKADSQIALPDANEMSTQAEQEEKKRIIARRWTGLARYNSQCIKYVSDCDSLETHC